MIPKVQLVSDSDNVSDHDLENWSHALQTYTDYYLGYFWHHHAIVGYEPKGQQPDSDAWYIKISDSIDQPGAAGVHLNEANNQPYAEVEYQPDGTTSIVISHEYAEMLGDPYGNRLATAPSQTDLTKMVQYLVEFCDPCEDNRYAKDIGGVLLSDFITHNYHWGPPYHKSGVLSAFDNIKHPRQVLPNGYISWYDPADKNWYQKTNFEGEGPKINNLGELPAGTKSIREWINSKKPDRD